jgi:hypothetical protein
LILYPSRRRPDPAPLSVNRGRVALVGIGVWVVALVVTWVRWRVGDASSTSVWTCLAGIGLGLAALVWFRLPGTEDGD